MPLEGPRSTHHSLNHVGNTTKCTEVPTPVPLISCLNKEDERNDMTQLTSLKTKTRSFDFKKLNYNSSFMGLLDRQTCSP